MLQFTIMSSYMDWNSMLKKHLKQLVAVDLLNPWRNVLIQSINNKRAHKQD